MREIRSGRPAIGFPERCRAFSDRATPDQRRAELNVRLGRILVSQCHRW
jgi:hypothetical protein